MLSDAVSQLHNWLAVRGLQMNVEKTQAMFILPSRMDLPTDVAVSCSGRPLSVVPSYKYLGLHLDCHLNWSVHIVHIIRKVSAKIAALRRAGKQLTSMAKRQYYISVIQSDLEYGSNAFYSSLPQSAKDQLSRLGKRGIRSIVGAPPWTHTAPLFNTLNIFPILKRLELKLLLLTYRCTHSLASHLLCDQYTRRTPTNSTRSTTRAQITVSLCIPRIARRSGSISPLFTSSLLWNSLPSLLRSPVLSFSAFRHQLYKYLGFPVIRP